MLTQKELKALLHYDPNTGIFKWKVGARNSIKVGAIAGCKDSAGYFRIRINGKDYKAHRLAWLYMEGYWPEPEIDHINGVRHDNRWKNLRMVSPVCNGQNKTISSRNTSGFTGVCWSKAAKKWVARITIHRRRIHIGYYDTPLDAAIARLVFEQSCPGWHCDERCELFQRVMEELI